MFYCSFGNCRERGAFLFWTSSSRTYFLNTVVQYALQTKWRTSSFLLQHFGHPSFFIRRQSWSLVSEYGFRHELECMLCGVIAANYCMYTDTLHRVFKIPSPWSRKMKKNSCWIDTNLARLMSSHAQIKISWTIEMRRCQAIDLLMHNEWAYPL